MDVFYALYDCALGISPVTPLSGVTSLSGVRIPYQNQILGRCKHCTETYEPNKETFLAQQTCSSSPVFCAVTVWAHLWPWRRAPPRSPPPRHLCSSCRSQCSHHRCNNISGSRIDREISNIQDAIFVGLTWTTMSLHETTMSLTLWVSLRQL